MLNLQDTVPLQLLFIPQTAELMAGVMKFEAGQFVWVPIPYDWSLDGYRNPPDGWISVLSPGTWIAARPGVPVIVGSHRPPDAWGVRTTN